MDKDEQINALARELEAMKVSYDRCEYQLAEVQQRIAMNEEVYHQLRLHITTSCGDPYAMALDGVTILKQRAKQAEAKLVALTNLEGKPQCWKAEHIGLEARLAEAQQRIAELEAKLNGN